MLLLLYKMGVTLFLIFHTYDLHLQQMTVFKIMVQLFSIVYLY